MNKFINFLNDIKEKDPTLVEAVQKVYNLLFESTEELVDKVKAKVKPEEDILQEEELIPEEEEINELPIVKNI